MRLRCPSCETIYGPEEPFCPACISPLEPVTPSPETGGVSASPHTVATPTPEGSTQGRADWDTTACWRCGTKSPNQANTECLNPECRRSLIPPALVITFEFGLVEVEPGSQTVLGRQGDHRRTFHPFSNVSRQHATVGVDRDGEAWIDPLPTINGTFVNDAEIDPGRRVLRTDDIVRLARDAKGTVKLYRR